VGNVSEFSGIGHGMLVSAGKHRVKIALPGYQAFETEVSLLARQKITIKTDLQPVSVSQAATPSKPNREAHTEVRILGVAVVSLLKGEKGSVKSEALKGWGIGNRWS